MTKDELFIWAQHNIREYLVLEKLREEVVNGTAFLFLPGKRGGAYNKGLYLCLYENSTVYKLREAGYAADVVTDYKMARDVIFDCVQFTEKWKAGKQKNK